MRDIVSGLNGIEAHAKTRALASSLSTQPDNRVHMLAVYGAFALIAAIVFGTLSYHPF